MFLPSDSLNFKHSVETLLQYVIGSSFYPFPLKRFFNVRTLTPTNSPPFVYFLERVYPSYERFLTELFDRITEMNGTDDTEYEDDDDDELEEDMEDAGEDEREDIEEAYDSQPVFHDMPPPATQSTIHPNSAPDDEFAVSYSHPIHPVTFPPTTTPEVQSTSSNCKAH